MSVPTSIIPLSVASVRAIIDAREERRREAEREMDHKTFLMLQQNITDGNIVHGIEHDGKHGYKVVYPTCLNVGNIRRIISMLQASVGTSEKVTFTKHKLGFVVTVLKL